MAILLPSEMITAARRDCVDTDSVDPAFADAIYLTKLNKYYLMWSQKIEQRITVLTPTQSGLTYAASDATKTTTPVNIFEIVEAHSTSGASVTLGTPLEPRTASWIRHKQQGNTADAPIYYSATRAASAALASVGAWSVAIYPIYNGAGSVRIALYVRAWPALMAAADTAPPDVTELGAYTISKLAAAEIAGMMGEDEAFIAHILRDVSDEIMSQMGVPRIGHKRPVREEQAA
jgi:hypothetical protein